MCRTERNIPARVYFYTRIHMGASLLSLAQHLIRDVQRVPADLTIRIGHRFNGNGNEKLLHRLQSAKTISVGRFLGAQVQNPAVLLGCELIVQVVQPVVE